MYSLFTASEKQKNETKNQKLISHLSESDGCEIAVLIFFRHLFCIIYMVA